MMTTKARCRRTSFGLAAVLAGAIIGTGCGKPDVEPPPPPPDATKVGFVYVGPIGDYGWTKSHEDGRLYLEAFGTNVKTTFQESVLPDQAPQVIDDMVAAGSSIIITTSYDFLQAAKDAVARHPGVTFLNAAGFAKGERLGTYFSRLEEAEYLTGMIAGRMTQTNKIGVVAAVRNYEQITHINAFALGVQKVNPDAEVLVRWTGFWFDPPREVVGTRELIQNHGVDVIKGKTDTGIPYEEAAVLNVFSLAHDNKDACSKTPNHCLASAYFNWGPLYTRLVEEVRTGTYPADGRIDYLSMADLDVHDLSTINAKVPQSVRDEVAATRAKIVDGSLNVFTGPINFQGPISSLSNVAELAAGETITDEQLSCAKSLVEGVVEVAGPACSTDDDCKHETLGVNKMTCISGLCTAADLGGCPQ